MREVFMKQKSDQNQTQGDNNSQQQTQTKSAPTSPVKSPTKAPAAENKDTVQNTANKLPDFDKKCFDELKDADGHYRPAAKTVGD